MKLIIISLFCMMMFSCKEIPKEIEKHIEKEKADKIDKLRYPEALYKIFEAHGGLSNWKSKRTLSFEIPKKDKTEKHTIDLHSRDEKIEIPGISMGSDKGAIWLLDEQEAYKGDAVFYHNLMFYFYAMPFVLSDNGINYLEVQPIAFEGNTYPGIRISYDEGVGLSAKDDYYIHYNPETYQMEWLGYTVTFTSGEKSDNVKWIRYNDWMNVDGLQLPKSITWHEYEAREIKEAKSLLNFENVSLSVEAPESGFFVQPKGAKIVQ